MAWLECTMPSTHFAGKTTGSLRIFSWSRTSRSSSYGHWGERKPETTAPNHTWITEYSTEVIKIKTFPTRLGYSPDQQQSKIRSLPWPKCPEPVNQEESAFKNGDTKITKDRKSKKDPLTLPETSSLSSFKSSGAMKAGVPAVLVSFTSSPANSLLTPKSEICRAEGRDTDKMGILSSTKVRVRMRPTLIRPSSVRSRLDGLMSRWIIFWKCTGIKNMHQWSMRKNMQEAWERIISQFVWHH